MDHQGIPTILFIFIQFVVFCLPPIVSRLFFTRVYNHLLFSNNPYFGKERMRGMRKEKRIADVGQKFLRPCRTKKADIYKDMLYGLIIQV